MADLSALQARTAAAWQASPAFRAVAQIGLFYITADLADDAPTRLYAICEDDGSAWKFGVASDPEKRLSGLQVGNPRHLVLFAHAPATQRVEGAVHRLLRRDRLSGEWFRASRRALVVAEMIRAAGEQCRDVEKAFGSADADDAVSALTFEYEELRAVRREAVSATRRAES